MTVAHLKKSMDLRFLRVDRRFAKIDRQFARVDRRFARVDRRFENVDRRFTQIDDRLDRIEQTIVVTSNELREQIARSAVETRRHFEMVAEGMRDDLRIFADAIGLNSERLNRHETRITRLEQRNSPSGL